MNINDEGRMMNAESVLDIEACIDGWCGEGFEETAKAARAELTRLQRIKELAREVYEAVDVTMGLFTSSGIDLQTYLNLHIGDLKEAHEALAAALEGDAK